MSEFHIGLFVIGGLAVVAVLVYNRVQEMQVRKRAARFAGALRTDALLQSAGERKEPTLDRWLHEPGRGAAGPAHVFPDEKLDYIVELSSQASVPAVTVLEPLVRRFANRVTAAGALGPGEWFIVRPGDASRCNRIRAALQLVKRSGAISEADLIEFRTQIETVAARLGASVSAPEMKAALEAARALDRLCMETDIQIALHVVAPAGAPFERDRFSAALRNAGLEAEDTGHWCARDGGGRLLYAASERADRDAGSHPGGLTLLLDVPHIPDVRRTYEAMVRCGRQLASVLGGELQDDNGRALDDRALSTIEDTLADVVRMLDERGFAPGGALAARLFS